MSRYCIRPRSAPDGDFHDPLLPHLSVDGERVVDTGLIYPTGVRVYRVQERIGFHNPRERG